jgi:hypothetical protein
MPFAGNILSRLINFYFTGCRIIFNTWIFFFRAALSCFETKKAKMKLSIKEAQPECRNESAFTTYLSGKAYCNALCSHKAGKHLAIY